LLDTDQKIILLVYQNNFVEILKIMSNANKIDILATSLSVLHNYFHSLTKLLYQSFSNLYPAKILDLSAKPFFPCKYGICNIQ